MEKVVTIFLGAGFSKICGFPLVSEANEEFENNLNNKRLTMHSSSEWGFINQKPNLYNEMLKSIIEYYKKSTNKSFDYEETITWLIENKDKIFSTSEISSFRQYERVFHDIENEFKSMLIHLVRFIISKKINEEKIIKYQFLIDLINRFQVDGRIINFFTLNHDILLERILEYNGFQYSDGFSVQNSPVVYLKKRLPIYNFSYGGDINVHKLHGSFNYYNLYLRTPGLGHNSGILMTSEHYLKLKTNDYLEKHQASFNIKKLNPDNSQFNPDIEPNFIMGKDKVGLINGDYVYNDVLRRLQISYIMSDLSIIIGYSFRDDHVNEIMDLYGFNSKMDVINLNPNIKYPLNKQNKHLNVVDIKKPGQFGYELQVIEEKD